MFIGRKFYAFVFAYTKSWVVKREAMGKFGFRGFSGVSLDVFEIISNSVN